MIIFTARGSSTGIDLGPTTENQIKNWSVTYDSLVRLEPFFDVMVDDKAIAPRQFFPRGTSSSLAALLSESRREVENVLRK